MEYIEVSARTVDDAITEALIKLGATSDQIEYEVIEKGSTGFLGIARKDAVIKVRKKYSVEGDITEFLQKIFAAMDLKVEIIIEKAEDGKYSYDEKGNTLTLIYTDDETLFCSVKSFSESALIISYTEGSSTREDYFVKQ